MVITTAITPTNTDVDMEIIQREKNSQKKM